MKKNISYQFRNQFRNKFFLKFWIGKAIIIIIVMLGVIIFFPHFFRSTYVVTVVSKRVITPDNNNYLIYTQMEDGSIRVFENTNNLLEFKIHSEDVYWELIINRKYEIKAYGLNIPLLSSYQNIIKVSGLK